MYEIKCVLPSEIFINRKIQWLKQLCCITVFGNERNEMITYKENSFLSARNSASDIQNCDSFPAIFHLLQCQAMLVREIKCKSCLVRSQKEICSVALPKIFLSGESHMK